MLESTNNSIVYQISDSRTFNYPYRFFSGDDLAIYLSEDDQGKTARRLEPGEYAVEQKNNYDNGAYITLAFDISTKRGLYLVIARELPLTQDLSLTEYSKLPAKGFENQLDRIVMMLQQLQEEINRCLKVIPTDQRSPDEVIEALMAAQKIAISYADEAQVFANRASVNADTAKYWAQEAREAVVSGDISYTRVGDGTIIITPNVVTTEDDVEYDILNS